MNVFATGFLQSEFDSSLATVLDALAGHEESPLVIEYDGKRVRAGYHVTEVKAGSFIAMDCGGNPDTWQETILQIEDIPAPEGETFISVGKFCAIVARVHRKVPLSDGSRLTIEIGMPGVPMQVFDVVGVETGSEHAILRLGARPAICKPRHRADSSVARCAIPAANNTSCCA